MARRLGYALSAVLATLFIVAGAHAESHVRIIRMSYIDGSVQMDRATGEGLERAILNTPITEGVRLVTGNDGLAEVEFENNSTVRVGENSEVRFTKLVVNDDGAKVNEVELVRGTVYFDTKGNKDDLYRATIGDSAFLIHRDSQVRISDESGNPTVAVMKGKVELQAQPREVEVSKRETLTVDPNNSAGYEISKGVETAPLDRWNDERSAYQSAYAYNNYGVGSNLNGYGYSDLNYYGGWSYQPGIGYGWQPYGVAGWGGWNPYLAGAWAWCPGFGYTWASAYPWGWLPYHYGAWSFIGGAGWFWFPGNFYRNHGWYAGGFQTAPVVHGPAGWVPPTRPPVAVAGMSSAPTVKVGTIGNLPPTIPGGRVPPNFRSVVPAMAPPRVADRALNIPGHVSTPHTPATANRAGSMPVPVGADTRAIYGQYAGGGDRPSGHVFAPPSRTASPGYAGYGMGGAYGGVGHPGYGMGAEPSMGASHAMGAPSGASHAMGPTGGHSMGGGGSHGGSGGHGPSPR